MEYDTNNIASLISHIHTQTAVFTNKMLSKKCKLVSSHGFILFLLSIQPFFSAENLVNGSFYQNLLNNFMNKSDSGISIEEVISNV